MHHRHAIPVAILCVDILVGCAGRNDPTDTSPSGSRGVSGSGVVFAAASLTDPFKQIIVDFEKANPRADLQTSFGASSALATQIVEQGGVTDVFASADEDNMAKVNDTGNVDGSPSRFIRNKLEIVVEAGNPKGVKMLADLARADLKVVLAAPQVPVGRYGKQALGKAGVTVKPVSQEPDVKGVLQKVALGEADAGIVYRSDVKAGGSKVAGVAIPDEHNVIATYPIAVIKGGKGRAVGKAFVDYVLSPAGRRTLVSHGFLAP